MFEELHNYRRERAWLRQLASPVFAIALTIGVLVHLAGFLVFRVMTAPLPAPSEKPPFVNYVSAAVLAQDSGLEERSVLMDSAPLFIPTEWSSTRQKVLLGRDSTGDGFAEFEPEIRVLQELKPMGITEVEAGLVSAPIDLLGLRFWDLFQYLGRTATEPVPFETSEVSARIYALGAAGALSGADEAVEMDVVIPGLPSTFVMRPARMLVLVSGAGRLLSRPTLLQTSGDRAFDEAVLDWVGQSEIYMQLPVGYLEIEVYP